MFLLFATQNLIIKKLSSSHFPTTALPSKTLLLSFFLVMGFSNKTKKKNFNSLEKSEFSNSRPHPPSHFKGWEQLLQPLPLENTKSIQTSFSHHLQKRSSPKFSWRKARQIWDPQEYLRSMILKMGDWAKQIHSHWGTEISFALILSNSDSQIRQKWRYHF